jgi:hypothetical protein
MGWLRREATGPGEIKDLLGIVDRGLADSKVEAVSTDLRFIAAFSSALTVAATALRASGHRTAMQAGHHIKTIESLELTTKATPKLIQRFKTLNNKRKKSSYDGSRCSEKCTSPCTTAIEWQLRQLHKQTAKSKSFQEEKSPKPSSGDCVNGLAQVPLSKVEPQGANQMAAPAELRTHNMHRANESLLELSRFLTPPAVADHRNAPVNALGYLRVMFAVDDIEGAQ